MTSVTLQQLDNGDVYSSNGTSQNNSQSGTINVTNCDTEQITKLFPKCRPRADVNLNPLLVVRTNSSEGHDSNMSTEDTLIQNSNIETDRCEEWKKSTTKHVQEQDGDDDLNELDSNQDIGNDRIDRGLSPSADLSSEDDDDDDDAIHILNVNKGGAYKLRDSRVIEIAGGREIYSQSRTKAARKSRYIGSDYEKKKGVWDVRPLPCHDSIKLNNSREVTETVFSSEVCSIRHQRSNNNLNTTTPTTSTSNVKSSPSPSKSMAVVTSGEVVVFDDIGDDWRTQPDGENENESQSPFFKDFESPEPAQIIGNLPIAVYEGSPRRYGPRQPDNVPVYPPRPGFPQRVLPSEDVPQVTTSPSNEEPRLDPVNSTFDYLYEFSETRKVLEEFFKCPPDGDNSLLEENAFQDLDYELHRQARQSQVELNDGNTYVGQRLAKTLLEQGEQPNIDSPRNLSEFTKIQDHGVIEHENNFLDLSVGTGSSGDLGETEVGLQVGHSRNFTLSPETTDCDSNCGDLDSEMSLMLMENELGPSSVGLLGSSGDLVQPPDSTRLYSSMPILEDGLSSGHTSDNDNNNPTVILMKRQITEIEREIVHKSSLIGPIELKEETVQENSSFDRTTSPIAILISNDTAFQPNETDLHNDTSEVTPPPPAPAPHRRGSNEGQATQPDRVEAAIQDIRLALQRTKTLPLTNITNGTIPHQTVVSELKSNSPVWVPRQRGISQASRDSDSIERKPLSGEEAGDEEEADTDLETDRLLGQHRSDDQGFYDDKLEWRKPKSRTIMPSSSTKSSSTPKPILALSPTLQLSSTSNGCDDQINSIPLSCTPQLSSNPLLPTTTASTTTTSPSPKIRTPSTTPPTHSQLNDHPANGTPSDRNLSPLSQKGSNSSTAKSKKDKDNKKKGRNKEGLHEPSVLIEGVLFRARYLGSTQLVCEGQPTKSTRMMQAEEAVSRIKEASNQICTKYRQYGHTSLTSLGSYDTDTIMDDDEDDDDENHIDDPEENQLINNNNKGGAGGSDISSSNLDGAIQSINQIPPPIPSPPQSPCLNLAPSLSLALGVGATGTVFRLQFLGSVEVDEEGGRKRRKRLKKLMVEEAVTKIKALAPDGESQPSTEVDLFISTEKIMVLNTDLKEIMMDHALRTISYIADIGDLVVLMARRRLVPHEMEDPPKINRTPKMICHVFESEEAQFIAQSIGQAFQVAYMEFLKANGIEDHSFVKEMDYQEVLNSQEIFGDELQMFAKKEMQKEVVVPKSKGEILGVVIVESGWGSMLPTVVIANLAPAGAAARCGQLNIGDQIIAINGVSLVGLPLSTCQNYIKNSKNQTVVKLTVVPCAPVVEVKIKRPDTKYQLGFSVQNGVICSLLRGGIAERGGVRVGHRIIEINNQSVVAVPHEKIVNLLATSVGEILMKTMPTSMFRLLTGQENPVYI